MLVPVILQGETPVSIFGVALNEHKQYGRFSNSLAYTARNTPSAYFALSSPEPAIGAVR